MKTTQTLALLAAIVGGAISSSCATTKGFGQDLQKVGNRIENRANATGGAEPAQPSASPSGPYSY